MNSFVPLAAACPLDPLGFARLNIGHRRRKAGSPAVPTGQEGNDLIAHVEIPVSDLERAMRFYASVFGMAFGEVATLHGSRMAHFPFEEGRDGASGALAEGDVYVPTLHGAIIYLNVADLDAVLARALGEGSEILFPKTPLGDGVFIAEIRDSEGNRIALQSACGERP